MHTNPQKQFSSSDSESPAMKENSGVSKDWRLRLDILGIIYYVTGGLVAGVSGYFAIVFLSAIQEGEGGYFAGAALLFASACFVLGIVLVLVGGMLRERRGRIFCLIIGCLCLPALPPIGAILGIYTIFLMTRNQVCVLFGSSQKSASRNAKSKITTLIIAALVVWLALLATFKGFESSAKHKAEREADEKIVATTDELLLRLVSEDDALRARFGRFDRMERIRFYDDPWYDPWFTKSQFGLINFARIAHFADGDLQVKVTINVPAKPNLRRWGVRIDSWHFYEAYDSATGRLITTVSVEPILVAPDAAPQTTAPRVELPEAQ
jgi:hypothetical protein